MTKSTALRLAETQNYLEYFYGIQTGLKISEFLRPIKNFDSLGSLVVEQKKENSEVHLDLALIFDVDVLEAFQGKQATNLDKNVLSHSVVYEELSHFVYLAYNHHRGRNISRIELEVQSEIDRILLAYHSPRKPEKEIQKKLLENLFSKSYINPNGMYEESRDIAAKFIRKLSPSSPDNWKAKHFETLREFFHSDMSEKICLSRLDK